MNGRISENLNNPEILEELYHDDRDSFKAEFNGMYPIIAETETAKFWKARLEYESKSEIIRVFPMSEVLTVLAICLIPALLVKVPSFLPSLVREDEYFQKNLALIVFLGLTLYTMWLSKIKEPGKILLTFALFLIPAVYINFLPGAEPGDSVILAFIHLPVLMLYIFGYIFSGFDLNNNAKRIEFIRHMAQLVIVYGLIAIAGGVLTAITIGLFGSIGLDIENFYTEYIVAMGAAAAPVIASCLIEKFPGMVSRIAPVIAGIFSPVVLITLVVFLITMFAAGKDPYNDRDFLIIFNFMLLGVMAIILFSVSETSVARNFKLNAGILFALSVVTIITDLVALSAIFYRLGEYGLTPNRLAVLISNFLVLVNMILILNDLFRILFRAMKFSKVEITVSKYLSVYLIWIIIVVFGFPAIFSMV